MRRRGGHNGRWVCFYRDCDGFGMPFPLNFAPSWCPQHHLQLNGKQGARAPSDASVDNEAALREAAAMVDNQMTRIKNGSNTKGIERVAVMAAISIASDLLSMQRQAASDSALPIDTIRARLADLNARTDEALRQYGEVI